MNRHRSTRRSRGVSLIEALTALAVMAFGMLGVVGMQATLRSNSDVSKQRAEAVRIAQEQLENWRAYAQVGGSSGSFESIADDGGSTVAGYEISNTSFTRSTGVTPDAPGESDPRMKSVVVDVRWTDRNNETLNVTLASIVAAVPPELAGALALPADRVATQRPLERHPAIPPQAITNTGADAGTSTFTPPGASGVSWVFNNNTGFIVRVCNPVCSDVNLAVLSGFIALSTLNDPVPVHAGEIPEGAAVPVTLGVQAELTAPGPQTVACYADTGSTTAIGYYCALPLTTTLPSWSGTVRFVSSLLSPTTADYDITRFKVCRYTGTPASYTAVRRPLANQNYLLIRAGDGTVPFACPADNPATPLIDGGTVPHQPST